MLSNGSSGDPKGRVPPIPKNVGKVGKITAIDGTIRQFEVVDEITCEQEVVENGTKKLIYFQKLRWKDTGKEEYRFTYYMLGLKPGALGRWVFGQYSLLIPCIFLGKLLKEARRRGWKHI